MTKIANRFTQPMDYYGNYRTASWAGYVFKEVLGYTSGLHTGVDYNGAGGGNSDLGMEIKSIADGIVRYVGNRTDLGFGNTTIVEHPLSPTLKKELKCDSLFARYMHQNTIDVAVGQEVSIGQRIGTVGNTGTVYAHLHVDLYKSTIEGGGVHFRYDKDTELQSYLDVLPFIREHNTAVDVETLLGYQRKVQNADGVNGRSAPNVGATIVKEFSKGEVLDFKGYVVGQDPYGNGNSIWFVGRYSDTYWYSGAFEDRGTHDLPDLTPTAPSEPSTPSDPGTPSEPSYPEPTSDPQVTRVINKNRPLAYTYMPSDLVVVGNGQSLRKEAAHSLVLMSVQAPFIASASGYRSAETQKSLYDAYVAKDGQAAADRYSARPGYSEHQTGLAMDFAPIDDSFVMSPAYNFLVENGYKYGWVLRYPEDKEAVTGYMSEPWHWRYVGVDVATDMHNKGITTLEEYFGVAGGDYSDVVVVPPVVDPVTPTPPTPEVPALSDEAAKSATQFVARVGSQLAAAAVIVNGLAVLAKQYVDVTISGNVLGIATIVTGVALVAYAQYKYKKSGGAKGWFF